MTSLLPPRSDECSVRYIFRMIKRDTLNRSPSSSIAELQAEHGLLRIGDVCRLTGLRSRTSVYALVRRGELPQPVKIGRRASAWRAADVIRFIDSREVNPLARPIPSADAPGA